MKPSPQSPETQFYEEHFPRLVVIATSDLHMPEDEAQSLVHDLLTAMLFRRNPPPHIESWLEGALRIAARRLAEVRT
jgi:hypothetical protein